MFVRLTQEPDGLPIYIRSSRVLGFAKTSEGTRVFLTGAFNCLVAEDEEAVLRALTTKDHDIDDR